MKMARFLQNVLQPILFVFKPNTIDTMLQKNGPLFKKTLRVNKDLDS